MIGRKRSQLLREAKIYKQLKGNEGIPNVYHVFTEGGFNGMVMDLLGPSLAAIAELCGGHLETPTMISLAEQMIGRIETFHSKGLIHRDIKPDNFAVGRNKDNTIAYIIDYGLVKRFTNDKGDMHIPFKQNKKLVGTARYSSINTHIGYEQSRRDDLEGLGYTFVYLAKGNLPWQGIKADTKKDKYRRIMESKNSISIETLCKGMPSEFAKYLFYCRNLQFEDSPNYGQLIRMFRDCFYKYKFNRKFAYDWIKQKVDLNSYKKPENPPSNRENPLSNRAENDNDDEEISRTKSREVKKIGLDKDAPNIKPLYKNLLDPKEIIRDNNIPLNIQKNVGNDKLTVDNRKEEDVKTFVPSNRGQGNCRQAEIAKLMEGIANITLYKVPNNTKGKDEIEMKNQKLNGKNRTDKGSCAIESNKNQKIIPPGTNSKLTLTNSQDLQLNKEELETENKNCEFIVKDILENDEVLSKLNIN